MSVFSPILTASADLAEATQKFDKESGEFLEDAEEARDIINILDKNAKENPKPERNSIDYVMKRLLYPGVYVNDVRDAIVSDSTEVDKDDLLHDGIHACNPDAPVNLIGHNCNIPNFTTGLIQNVVDPFTEPFSNAGKSSSYSVFGLGVPSNIPGDIVPIRPESRTNTYTALELYGYSLKLTSYNGEWDHVLPSDSARMLSNFGVIDRITLVGTSLWNGAREGVGAFIENFSFNPVRWYGNITNAYETGASSSINTVVDTSELNIIATNAWKRPRLDGTLYNVYVLTDAEVIRETARGYFAAFNDGLNEKASENQELKEVLALNPNSALDDVKKFVYDPTWETDESKEERKAAREKRSKEKAHNESERLLVELYSKYTDVTYEPNYIDPLTKIPEPIFYTESQQLGFWEEDPKVSDILRRASGNGLLTGNAGTYSTYSSMIAEWEDNYTPYFETNFDALGNTVNQILEDNDADVFTEYPHLDPKQGISRYACANPDGTLMRASDGTIEYLYEKNNSGTEEYVNSKCSNVRDPIGGGLLGSGWESPVIDDTRHISNVSDDSFGILHQTKSVVSSTISGLNSFIAKFTNVVLDLSFSPILEKLGIDIIIGNLVEGFRDTVFFPLVTLAASIGALLLFFEVLKSGSVWRLLGSLAITIVIFIAGAAFLMHPTATIQLVDEVPTSIDRIVANAILVDDDGTSYCSTGDNDDGIRSAQCNVWGAMVFEPWVHLQFGTGYDNLYAKGHAPSGSNEFKNNNESLVGDAAVNMGGGVIVNNWAMYQLEKTKSGTINSKAPSESLGTVDKDLYRLVDLQAGPDNGANSDTRHFENWSGQSNNGFLLLLTLLQSILMSIAIAGLGIAKIEASFMFSISIIFLPFMLLYALLPKGRAKLTAYLGNLASLLLKRILITVMLAVLLKIITLSYANSDTIETGAMIGIFVSLAFILYRKELLDLMTVNESGKGMIGQNTEQVKQAIQDSIPQYVKQTYSVMKAGVQGTAAGFAGGALGAADHRRGIRSRRSTIRKELEAINRLEAEGELTQEQSSLKDRLMKEDKDIDYTVANQKKLSESKYGELKDESNEIHKTLLENELEIKKLMEEDQEKNAEEIAELHNKNLELKERQEEIAIQASGGVRGSGTILAQAVKGSVHSKNLIGRTAERRIRRQGFTALTAVKDIKDSVYVKGADSITNLEEGLEYDTYKEVLSHSRGNSSKTASKNLQGSERGQLEKDPRIQKRVRQLAEERRRISSEKDYSNALIPDLSELEKAAEIVDRRRRLEKAKDFPLKPIESVRKHNADIAERESQESNVARSKSIKKEIEDHIENLEEEDKNGISFKDRRIQEEVDKKQKIKDYSESIDEIIEEMDEVDARRNKKAREELEELTRKKVNPKEDE